MIIRDMVKMFDIVLFFNFLISYRIRIILLLLFVYFLFSLKNILFSCTKLHVALLIHKKCDVSQISDSYVKFNKSF